MSLGRGTLQLFFMEALKDASSQLHLTLEQWTEFYLVNLMVQYAREPGDIGTPIVLQLERAVSSSNQSERFIRLRGTGDVALFLAGFLAAHIEYRGLSRSYVAGLGGNAYRQAAMLSLDGYTHVYLTLAEDFEKYAELLDEVRELTSLRTPQDVVKLYERWSRTGSASSLRRLQASGVFPGSPTNIRH